jgi:hypothetical protein
MKTRKIAFILMWAIVILMLSQLFANTNTPIEANEPSVATDTCVVDSFEIEEEITIPEHFDYVYDRFKVFNPDLDSATVILFNEVCTHYDLDTTPELLKWCVGQILLESGAKQYYEIGHPKEGQLVKSSAGARGFTQIMPNTAYGNLKKYITDEEADCMYGLGATSFEFIKKDTSKSALVNMSAEWIENETNNIILWGFIMRRKLNDRPDILKVLVSYNAGTGGMINYVNNGGILSNHKYVKGIQTKLNYAEAHI